MPSTKRKAGAASTRRWRSWWTRGSKHNLTSAESTSPPRPSAAGSITAPSPWESSWQPATSPGRHGADGGHRAQSSQWAAHRRTSTSALRRASKNATQGAATPRASPLRSPTLASRSSAPSEEPAPPASPHRRARGGKHGGGRPHAPLSRKWQACKSSLPAGQRGAAARAPPPPRAAPQQRWRQANDRRRGTPRGGRRAPTAAYAAAFAATIAACAAP
mmetsp:Transcript_1656/g.4292  ORF Transcript_1656/g.4292 Transcript_1656/m.4292 type:complete len:218 (-) Transcript_1656:1117-1770(-)